MIYLLLLLLPALINACNVENCDSCLDATLCADCLSGYDLSGDQTQCTASLNCVGSIPNCNACSSETECKGCEGGFVLNTSTASGACDPETCLNTTNALQNCTTCVADSLTECEECDPGYTTDANKLCVVETCLNKAVPLANCKVCASVNACSECNADFVLDGDVCVAETCANKETDPIANCKTCTDLTTCEACDPGFVLLDDACEPETCLNTMTALQNCKVCVTDSLTECQECNENFTTDDTKQCVEETCINKATNPIANCATCTDKDNCLNCEANFVLVDNACVPETCLNKASPLANCAACASVDACSVCNAEFVVEGGLCVPETCINKETDPIANCATCTDKDNCAACETNYVLDGNACVAETCLNTASPVADCKTCVADDLANCEVCNDGFDVKEGKCAFNCGSLDMEASCKASKHECKWDDTKCVASSAVALGISFLMFVAALF